MVVLGIDPGYAIVGYGAIEHHGMKNRLICCGAITTKAHTPLHLRLAEIYQDTLTLLDQVKPDAVAIEELFFNTNITTGIQVAQARGVILCACAQKGYTPAEYTPSEVKQAVVGYGKAEKLQVMEMTRRMLGMATVPKPDDAADALAIAICHAHTANSVMK
jgi:crossover junction endodeoxyribonuclease RuvC